MSVWFRLSGVALVASAVLTGQQSLSTIRGTVKDASGAAVSGAEITITEAGTGIRARVIRSDDLGDFEAPGL